MGGERKDKFGRAAATGVVALVFFVIGLQTALFGVKFLSPGHGGFRVVGGAADSASGPHVYPADSATKSFTPQKRERSGRSHRSCQDDSRYSGAKGENSGFADSRKEYRREPESFPFDPNTVTQEELERLGLSAKQAAAIISYRGHGGKFYSKEDFKKMYTVSDSVFKRLEPFIRVTALDINKADSAELDALPGIGPYYASRIIAYRRKLAGYSSIGQLLEVKGMNPETYERLKGCVTVDTLHWKPLDLWKMSEDSLSRHPYVGTYAAKEIKRFKSVCDTSHWTVEELEKNGILSLSPMRRRQFSR
jgi:competence ComEA-like helix-hairpin-helix protein